MRCLYLHGFLGSPASAKARLFEERARRRGWTIEVPDLNAPDFRSLTITRVVELAASIVVPGQRWAVIGSSMGGWAAAHFASLHPERVSGLVLMCPAFNMPSLLEEQLGPDGLERWRSSGTIAIEHSGLGGVRELGYSFLVDAREWASRLPEPRCPTLILHGTRDEVVPISLSRSFAEGRPNVKLLTFAAGHSLEEAAEEVADRGVEHLESLAE